MVDGYVDIEKITKENTKYRHVVITAPMLQLVLMRLKPGETIDLESHEADQFFKVEQGEIEAIVDGTVVVVKEGTAIIIPSGAMHKIEAGPQGAHTYTLYSKNQHPPRTSLENKPLND